MKAYIYWWHLPEHTNFSEGYIGVTTDLERRYKESKRRFGNAVRHVIWVGEEENCYKIEEELRPHWYMGWNIARGGYKPSSPKGKKFTENHKKKLAEAKIGNKNGSGKRSEAAREKMRHPKSQTSKMGRYERTPEQREKLRQLALSQPKGLSGRFL